MSTLAEKVESHDQTAQVEVGVREAAQIAGVSQKQVRRWIRAGSVRATKRQSRHGPTWHIEASTLPMSREARPTSREGSGEGQTVDGQGARPGPGQGAADTVSALLRLIEDKDRRLEGAAVRIGQLEEQGERVKLLEAHAQSLQRERAEARSEANAERTRADQLGTDLEEQTTRGGELEAEVSALRDRIRWARWTAAIAVAGFVIAALTLLVR